MGGWLRALSVAIGCRASLALALTAVDRGAFNASAEWCRHKRVALVHHKAGTDMMLEANYFMNTEVTALCSSDAQMIELNKGDQWPDNRVDFPRDACVMHFERNPYELVVSGYIYHRSVRPVYERWVHRPMPRLFEFEPHLVRRQSAFNKLYEAAQGPLKGSLPEPRGFESFAGYLHRLNVEQGLIASALFAIEADIIPMLELHDKAPSHGCATNVCFNWFEEDCPSTWSSLMKNVIRVPQHKLPQFVSAATKSCPNVDKFAKDHHYTLDMGDSRLPELVRAVQVLDKKLLNSTLAAAAKAFGCGMGAKYDGRNSNSTAPANASLPTAGAYEVNKDKL